MKTKQVLFAAAAAFAASVAITGAASAASLYNNGPLDGAHDAFTIDLGWQVADSFNATGTATGMNFVTWNYPGDSLSAVDWAITDANPLNGGAFNIVASGVAGVTSSDIGGNNFGFDLQSNSISLGSVALNGSYWIMLQNANVTNGDPIYWDENSGPSDAWQANPSIGQVGYDLVNYNGVEGSNSQTFEITGAGGVPEPTTWALMLVGVGGLGGAMRAARRKTGAMVAA